ncbi:methyltransferase [Kitasatospora acidiphila]|uniref:Methyltransferase n=1 Tax=Kitasatospora acidiphila TaxID=2567942 RepID=A0A540W927_9ACTN|nr:methyltransferase [Kitasatospora acidiphila]TQF05526.1 methyltransferase [Kitasatospora acidiphila]
MIIDAQARSALEQADCNGPELRLPRLDSALYKRIDQMLAAVGGRWTRGCQAHVFPSGAAEVLAALLAAGQIHTEAEAIAERQFYPTPEHIAQQLIDLAGIEPGHQVLEPSAGDGAIARLAAARGAVVDCVELDPGAADTIRSAGYARNVTVGDFLRRPRRPDYDAVVMNPPFANRQDIRHIRHALGFVRPGGKLAAVMSAGITFWNDRAARAFRDEVDQAGGRIEPLPDDTWNHLGVKLRTVLVAVPVVGVVPTAPASPMPKAVRPWSHLTPADFGHEQASPQAFLLDELDSVGTRPFESFNFDAAPPQNKR